MRYFDRSVHQKGKWQIWLHYSIHHCFAVVACVYLASGLQSY